MGREPPGQQGGLGQARRGAPVLRGQIDLGVGFFSRRPQFESLTSLWRGTPFTSHSISGLDCPTLLSP